MIRRRGISVVTLGRRRGGRGREALCRALAAIASRMMMSPFRTNGRLRRLSRTNRTFAISSTDMSVNTRVTVGLLKVGRQRPI